MCRQLCVNTTVNALSYSSRLNYEESVTTLYILIGILYFYILLFQQNIHTRTSNSIGNNSFWEHATLLKLYVPVFALVFLYILH